MHYPADVVRPPLDQQENVICHKAICIQVKRKPLLLRPKQRDELPVVLLTMKNIPPVNATSNNVIKTTFDLKSWFPGHTFPFYIIKTRYDAKKNCENCRPDPDFPDPDFPAYKW